MPAPLTMDRLRAKVIEFQTRIIELKNEARDLKEKSDQEQKKMLLEQVDWFDLLELIVSDLKAHPATAESLDLLKSLERLRNKMQRSFESNAVTAVSPANAEQERHCLKVIETRAQPELADGVVLDIIRKGYKWKGSVLRKAEVVTVKN